MNPQAKPYVTAIIVAAGASRRMGFDKLSHRLPDGRTVLEASVQAFDSHPDVGQLVLVAGKNKETCEEIALRCKKPAQVVAGGETRADSVCAGLRVAEGELVAIHDAARPFVSADVISQTIAEAARTGAAAPAVAVKDTIKLVNSDGTVQQTPDRSRLFAVQTPQCFSRQKYLQALELVTADRASAVTDDCSLFELAGFPVRLTQGDYENIKITTVDDLKGESRMRIGHGYDVHRLVEGRKLILGGVEIPYAKGLLGHSDADVLLHAISDALLGAAALGDIGLHFPDNSDTYKGIDSKILSEGLVFSINSSTAFVCSFIIFETETVSISLNFFIPPKVAPIINAEIIEFFNPVHISVVQRNYRSRARKQFRNLFVQSAD